jgi:hypothetical protein
MEQPSYFECFCYCNPCWSAEEEEEEDDESFLINNDTDIQLSARSDDDGFTLPQDFDAIDDYYKSFNSIDGSDKTPSIHISEEKYEMIWDRLRTGTREGYTSLNSDLILFKMSIRDYHGDEMIEQIKSYEFFMDKYDTLRQQDDNATLYLDNARKHINKHEARVTYYKKAIYFTHDMTRKLIIRKEYINYCETLKLRQANICK